MNERLQMLNPFRILLSEVGRLTRIMSEVVKFHGRVGRILGRGEDEASSSPQRAQR